MWSLFPPYKDYLDLISSPTGGRSTRERGIGELLYDPCEVKLRGGIDAEAGADTHKVLNRLYSISTILVKPCINRTTKADTPVGASAAMLGAFIDNVKRDTCSGAQVLRPHEGSVINCEKH